MVEAKKYASKRVSSTDYPVYNDEYELELAFEEGAKWQRNNVWHSADDDPPINCKEVLIEYGNYYHDVGFYDKDSNKFLLRIDEAVRMKDVDRWAYLEDLGAL